MKIKLKKDSLPLVSAILLLCFSKRASASLFATFSLEQSIFEEGAPFVNSEEETPVISSTLPFQTTVTNTTTNNSVTATYNAYDNGTTSGLNINASAYTTALQNFVGEASYYDFESASSPTFSDYTNFSFNQPVDYTISFRMTGSATLADFELLSTYGNPVDIGRINGPETFSQSGTLLPGVVYYLDEEWGLNNIENTEPADNSGTDAISLTFTAIPEPGSLGLLLLPAALLSRRRRRKASERVQSLMKVRETCGKEVRGAFPFSWSTPVIC